MGNKWSIPNVNERTFPNDVQYFFLQYTNDNGQTFQAFEPGRTYYIKYKITHDATGRFVEKIHPKPFYIKPLYGVSFFRIRVVGDDAFRYNIFIDNLIYSHEMYRNTVVKAIIQARYVYEEDSPMIYNHLDRWIINQDFDTNNAIGWTQFNLEYIGEWVSIEVALYDTTNGNLLLKKMTPRIFIPLSIPAGQEITIYPQAII